MPKTIRIRFLDNIYTLEDHKSYYKVISCQKALSSTYICTFEHAKGGISKPYRIDNTKT
jgi:hypothetical protein